MPAYQVGATLGDRFGPLSLFASYDHVTSNSQPVLFVTAARPSATSATGTPVTGGYDDVNRTNAPIRVLGASGIEHQQQDRFKLKAALDVTPGIRLTYVGALFLNDTDAVAQTYLTDATTGQPAYAGPFAIDGRAYTVAPSAFSGGTYAQDQRHWSHSLSATGTSKAVDWQVIGTLYDYAHDIQRVPTTALPTAQTGGAGTIARLDGTGWTTLDAKAAWHGGNHVVSAGAHLDRFELNSNRYATTDWIAGSEGALNLQSKGKTRTAALWAQDAWTPIPDVTLTLGGRYEWWRAYDGRNFSLTPAIAATQPKLTAARFSPKASLAWTASPNWTARAAFGTAWRFPTVGELYPIVTTPVAAVPTPNLRPERALSEEISIEHHDDHGLVRVALFNESVKDALISQAGPLNGTTTLATFVQNVDRTRARGVEAAVQRTDIVDRFDLSASVTYADATTRANTAFPASVGKRLPQGPIYWAMMALVLAVGIVRLVAMSRRSRRARVVTA